MLRLHVDKLLKNKGMTRYALYKQLGMSYQNFNNMITNQTKSIRYEMIETLCSILECEPNDLFEYDFNS
jgi:Predicted transcriptional regulator